MTSLYRLALRAFPARHRDNYAGEMVEAFERLLATRRRDHGLLGALRFILAACGDAIKAGLDERRRHRLRGAPARRNLFGSPQRDLAHAVRSLSKARGFSVVSIMSLGIGIGTVISMLLFLRVMVGTPPGVSKSGLVEFLVIPQEALRAQVNDWAIDTWSYPDFEEIRDAGTGITIAGWTPDVATLRAPDGSGLRVDAMYVSPNYFQVLGVALARGGGFTQPSSSRWAEPEVVIAHRLWKNRFNSDPAILGRSIVIDGSAHVVVGVAPERFRGHLAQHRPGFQLWVPLAEHPRLSGAHSSRFDREVDWLQILGRLPAGRTLADANAMAASIMTGIAQRHPATNKLKSAAVAPYYPMGARRRGDTIAEASFFAGSAAVVLLVVCVNVSGMVLVRSASRERELAVRLAIGASRRQLIQYLLSEAVILAVLGGALGVAVIFGVPFALTTWAGTELDEFGQLTIDAPAIALGIGLCFATSVVFGLLPAVRFSRPLVLRALKDEAGGGGRRVGRVHRWGVAVQAGLAVPFLVVGGLQLDQFRRTASADLGFHRGGLFAVRLDLPPSLARESDASFGEARRPASAEATAVRRSLGEGGSASREGGAAANRAAGDPLFVMRVVQGHVEQASGVTSVGLANGLPLDSQSRRTQVIREGLTRPVRAQTTRVSPAYLATLGVALVRGRGITDDDRSGSELVVVISQELASQLFPDGDPIGQRVTFALDSSHLPGDARWTQQSTPASAQTFTVVGVTKDVVDAYMGPPNAQLFVPLAQHPAAHLYVVSRSSASQQAMAAAYERAVTGIYADPDVVGAGVITGELLVRRSRSELVMGSALSAVAAGAALLLAALGIFGVVGFMVATRTREIGIRIALGASRSRVLRGVLTDAVKLAAWGVAGGLGLALLWGQEVSWSDAWNVESLVYVLAVLIAMGVALLAGLPAARRAAAVEPIIAMRAE